VNLYWGEKGPIQIVGRLLSTFEILFLKRNMKKCVYLACFYQTVKWLTMLIVSI